jgi:hypothetical protein
MTARKHHFVPQCYLKGFCARQAKPKLMVFDRLKPKPFFAAVTKIAARRDFNRVDIEGQPPDLLESAYSCFETEVDQALKRVAKEQSFDDQEDRMLLFNLIALLAGRNPRLRERFREFEERVLKQMLRMTLATPERWESEKAKMKEAGYLKGVADLSYESFRKFAFSDNYRIDTSTTHHAKLEIGNFDELLDCIATRQWMLMIASPDSGGFVTSDHPVCLMHSPGFKPTSRTPLGYGLANTLVIFPVCSSLALWGEYEGADGVRPADFFTVAKVNAAVIAHAERQVYARDSVFYYSPGSAAHISRGQELSGDSKFRR